MDEARAVLARLERIGRLELEGAPARTVLEEVRALLGEAEAWLAVEPAAIGPADAALRGCRDALDSPET